MENILNDELENEIRGDVERELASMFPNYHSDFPEIFYDKIVEDVVETSAYNDERRWNDSDVRLAIERVTAKLCGADM